MAKKEYDYDKLVRFFKGVADLTFGHECIHVPPDTDYASVSPAKLGELLEKVDPEWYNQK
jgi:hypothetical protein